MEGELFGMTLKQGKILPKTFLDMCWIPVFSFDSLLIVKYFSREFKFIFNLGKQWLNYTYVLVILNYD